MQDIYEQHRNAFAQVEGFVICNRQGDRVATVAFKFPKDGAGRLYCYLHLIGIPMVRGFANGYGYDKRTAAMQNAVSKLKVTDGANPDMLSLVRVFNNSFSDAALRGGNWDGALREKEYKVMQAI